ncbi:HIRAN domain-containing protein [Pseudotabrizicola algicola]|uniref:HIRAN domain-containing protein n=1 Tax=Pseudotabrizicola algicola TaxID=2709381 RepID=A0A6B3RRY6_9RHOB|nr:HIRAN domain-containing protein [Pseudotabrizicola algicola]NEX48787.1 hypothetical protein [Pseudotabrizicola algicola]
MDRRYFLAGAAALPGTALARPSAAPDDAGLIELLSVRLVNRDHFAGRVHVAEGARVVLRRDPAWTYDPAAISVSTENGDGLGYLPPASTRALAALMDAGVHLEGRVSPDPNALRVTVLSAAVLSGSRPDSGNT